MCPRSFTCATAGLASATLACAGGTAAGTWMAWAGAAAIGVATLLAHLYVARRSRGADATTWRDAGRVAEILRRGTLGQVERSIMRELGTPVASLMNNLGAARRLLASERTGADRAALAEAMSALDEACSDADRTAHAIRRVPQVLGTTRLRREAIDVNDVAREAVRLVHGDAGARGVGVTTALAGDGLPVRGDADLLLLVALTLVEQAIENAAASARRSVTVSTAARGEEVELVVADTGESMTEVDRAHLFAQQPLIASTGFGWSLPLAHGVAEAHGGRILAERPERGTALRLVLPAAAESPARQATFA